MQTEPPKSNAPHVYINGTREPEPNKENTCNNGHDQGHFMQKMEAENVFSSSQIEAVVQIHDLDWDGSHSSCETMSVIGPAEPELVREGLSKSFGSFLHMSVRYNFERVS